MAQAQLPPMTGDLHRDPKLGRLVVISLVLHGLAILLLGGYLERAPKPDRRPVYYVDLVHKPVLNPQAGRPEPRPAEKPRPAPAAPVKATPPPAAKAEPVAPAKPVAKVVKPTPKAVPQTKPAPQASQDLQLNKAMEALRAKQQTQAEIDALKNRLAQLSEETTPPVTVPKEVPVGMADGSGSEVGVSTQAYIQAFIQQNWALSPYLLDRARLGTVEAKVQLVYAASGEMVRYRILEASGDSQFDDSIKRAIIKSKQLAERLPQQTELIVVFNLKEMAQARR